jgi:hypothetical protein
MGRQAATTKEELPAGITAEQLERLIAEKRRVGATRCDVVVEEGKRFLVCEFPPL